MNLYLSMSELFLLCWAIVATVVLAYFHTHYRMAMKGGIVLCAVVSALADGKATLKKQDNGKITIDMGDHEFTLKEMD